MTNIVDWRDAVYEDRTLVTQKLLLDQYVQLTFIHAASTFHVINYIPVWHPADADIEARLYIVSTYYVMQ